MDLARASRYWSSHKESKTFTLTISIYEAHLCFHGDGTANGAWDTKVAVSLPNDPMGERHETGRAGKTPNPVWDQTVVLRDIDYSDLVRVEMLGMRKIGENPVLASVEFEVHDVMGLSLREDASVFQLECDRSRARYGVILLAFRLESSLASDGFGELDGTESVQPVPRGVSPTVSRGEEEKRASHSSAPAWDAQDQSQLDVDLDEPVYINVGGHFACLLLDDDAPAQPLRSSFTRQSLSPPSGSLLSAGPVAAKDLAAFYLNSSPTPEPQPQHPEKGGRFSSNNSSRGSNNNNNSNNNNAHPRRFSSQSSSGRSENAASDFSDSAMYSRGSTYRKGGGGGGGGGNGNGGGGSGRGGKDLPPRTGSSSLGGNLAQQFSALGLGGGGSKSSGSNSFRKITRTMSSDARHAPSSGGFDARLDTQQRWSMPRLRNRQDSESDYGMKAEVKRVRQRGWTESFMRSPTLGGLRARAIAATGGGKSRSRSRSRSGQRGGDPAATAAKASAASFSANTSTTSVGRGEERRYMCLPHFSGANE